MTNAGSSYIIMFIILVQCEAQLAHFFGTRLHTTVYIVKDVYRQRYSLALLNCLFDFFFFCEWDKTQLSAATDGFVLD